MKILTPAQKVNNRHFFGGIRGCRPTKNRRIPCVYFPYLVGRGPRTPPKGRWDRLPACRIAVLLLLALSAALIPSCGGKSGSPGIPGNYATPVEKVRAYGIDISPDGATLYLANNVRGEVVVMDASTMRGAGTYEVSLNYGLQYIEYDSANKWILASHRRVEGAQRFFVYDVQAGETAIELEWEFNPTAKLGVDTKTFAYADGKAYLANGIGNMVIADLSSVAAATVTGTSMVSGAFGTALNPDATKLYATKPSSSGDNFVYVYNTADNSEAAKVTLAGCSNATHILLDDSRDRLYVSCGRSQQVIAVDVDANQLATASFSVGDTPANLAMTPDNNYLFVTNQEDDTVSMIDLDTSTVVKTFVTGDFPAGISVFSPYIYVTNVLGGSVSKIDFTGPSTVVAERTASGRAAGDPISGELSAPLMPQNK